MRLKVYLSRRKPSVGQGTSWCNHQRQRHRFATIAIDTCGGGTYCPDRRMTRTGYETDSVQEEGHTGWLVPLVLARPRIARDQLSTESCHRSSVYAVRLFIRLVRLSSTKLLAGAAVAVPYHARLIVQSKKTIRRGSAFCLPLTVRFIF